jgi:hypothetical protein
MSLKWIVLDVRHDSQCGFQISLDPQMWYEILEIIHFYLNLIAHCSEFLGYKTNPGNNRGRLKRWLIDHLGVLDKFSYGEHKDISLYFRGGLTIELWWRDKNAKNLSMSVHTKTTVSLLTLISQSIVWQWVHFIWTKCGEKT